MRLRALPSLSNLTGVTVDNDMHDSLVNKAHQTRGLRDCISIICRVAEFLSELEPAAI